MLAEKSSLKSISQNLKKEQYSPDYQAFPSNSSRLYNKSPKSADSGKSISRLYPRLSNSSIAESQHPNTSNGFLPSSLRRKKKSLTFNTKYLLDTGGRMEPHGPSIIYGVESEEVEEINDAYNDLIGDLGERCEKIIDLES